MTKKHTTRRQVRPKPSALAAKAIAAFDDLTPSSQVTILYFIGRFHHPSIPLWKLLATTAQREANRHNDAISRQRESIKRARDRARAALDRTRYGNPDRYAKQRAAIDTKAQTALQRLDDAEREYERAEWNRVAQKGGAR